MREYRGIKVADGVKLYNGDGRRNRKTQKCLDGLFDLLQSCGHDPKLALSRFVGQYRQLNQCIAMRKGVMS